MSDPKRILVITGMSGAGRTTALKTLEDLGWETADNLPLVLLDRLLERPLPEGASDSRPFALGIDSRTRGFDAAAVVRRVHALQAEGRPIEIVFFDCNGAELAKRFSATRRRHPLALDRQAEDGIARERELLTPLREAAATLIDTSDLTSNGLQAEIRARFSGEAIEGPTLVLTSFGFSRGLPRNADLVFDLRFLRNPHWEPALRPGTGLDAPVADYVKADPAYPEAMDRFEGLLTLLLPRYASEGKSYITVAFGCTGGRHRSVHGAEEIGRRLRMAGFSPTITHRDLTRPTTDAVERGPEASDLKT